MTQEIISDGADNFFNLVEKQFEYERLDVDSRRILLSQKMLECGLGFDIPIYLL
jgi:hypothetical protein